MQLLSLEIILRYYFHEIMVAGSRSRARNERNATLTKAVLRAAHKLGLSSKALAQTLGVSEATTSRMSRGSVLLEESAKSFELAVLLVRLFRSLDAIVGGDEAVARAWLTNHNTALDGRPVDKIRTIAGLLDVIAYLDARRALV